MSRSTDDNLPRSLMHARSKVAHLFGNGKTPLREDEVAARQQFQTAKVDQALREAHDYLTQHDIGSLHPAQVEYLSRLLNDLLGGGSK